MIKLLALDLDGTLLNSSGEISPKNKKTIEDAEAKGVLVTIATGRRFRDARPVGLELNLNAPVICHNGALLKFAKSLETVAVSILPYETLREILRVGREFGADALASCDPRGKGTLLYETVSDANVPLQKYIEWSKRLHGAEAEDAVHRVENLETVLEENETVHVSFSGTVEPMTHLEMILRSELNDTANVMTTVYPRLDFTLIDILPSDASKGIGVEKLALINNFSAENVMVVGDNFNDLEMLEYAGTAVVMGNASPELLEREEFHETLSNDENGVALAIEKIYFAMIILETERCFLRTWNLEDAEDALKIWGDSQVMKYVGEPFDNLKKAERALQNAIAAQEKNGVCLWAVVEKSNETIIGACGFHLFEEKVLEIAYHFIPEFWGKGFASETVESCIEYAFTKIDIEKIVGFTDLENVGSQKVLEKNGFEFIKIETFDEKPERRYELKKRF